MSNTAQSILLPSSNSGVLLRVAFLHVGQGSSAVIMSKSGTGYTASLLDINTDRKAGGIDVPRLVRDLVGDVGLRWFINTHPHDDHLLGLESLAEEVKIHGVMHSGHKPGRQFQDAYKQLGDLIQKVKKAGGEEITLNGSRTPVAFDDAQMHVLAPALYITDEVNDEDPDVRYDRIHEQCAVIKFGDGTNWIMIPGDADHVAFKDHIMYHKDRLNSFVLAASHHGSRTFFMEKDEDEPYLEALRAISPTYVVVSAPTQDLSKHRHPHDVAIALYEDEVGEENIFHTGQDKFTFIFDIYTDGTVSGAMNDSGKLADDYGLADEDDDGGGTTPNGPASKGPFISTSSRTGDLAPRKFG